jgi:hypothetical protein
LVTQPVAFAVHGQDLGVVEARILVAASMASLSVSYNSIIFAPSRKKTSAKPNRTTGTYSNKEPAGDFELVEEWHFPSCGNITAQVWRPKAVALHAPGQIASSQSSSRP